VCAFRLILDWLDLIDTKQINVNTNVGRKESVWKFCAHQTGIDTLPLVSRTLAAVLPPPHFSIQRNVHNCLIKVCIYSVTCTIDGTGVLSWEIILGRQLTIHTLKCLININCFTSSSRRNTAWGCMNDTCVESYGSNNPVIWTESTKWNKGCRDAFSASIWRHCRYWDRNANALH
jgi:hypothetical protein